MEVFLQRWCEPFHSCSIYLPIIIANRSSLIAIPLKMVHFFIEQAMLLDIWWKQARFASKCFKRWKITILFPVMMRVDHSTDNIAKFQERCRIFGTVADVVWVKVGGVECAKDDIVKIAHDRSHMCATMVSKFGKLFPTRPAYESERGFWLRHIDSEEVRLQVNPGVREAREK